MKNIVIFANENQFSGLKRHHVMIEEMEKTLYSEEEVKLLAERLKRIAQGNAVTVQHEEVKRHIIALLQDEYQMA
ncbi:MAG: hypothetical protein J6P73_00280 [Bacteroidales bacterium]|nr:hypothetical protein [Bacteroidales bacterium]